MVNLINLINDNEKLEQYFQSLTTHALQAGFIGEAASRQEHYNRHIIDSLLPITDSDFCANLAECVVDLGSGAGLPAIPLAIHFTDRHFFLIEQTQKRANYLNQVIRELSLPNVEVLNVDINELKIPPKQIVSFARRSFTYRAFRKPLASLEITRKLAQDGDNVLYWRSKDFLEDLPAQIKVKAAQRIDDLGYLKKENIILEIPPECVSQMQQRMIMHFVVTKSSKAGFPRRWKKIKEDLLVESVI